jgi:hypothetical protein
MHRYPFKKLDFPTQADASFKILEFPSENFHGQSFKFASEIQMIYFDFSINFNTYRPLESAIVCLPFKSN